MRGFIVDRRGGPDRSAPACSTPWPCCAGGPAAPGGVGCASWPQVDAGVARSGVPLPWPGAWAPGGAAVLPDAGLPEPLPDALGVGVKLPNAHQQPQEIDQHPIVLQVGRPATPGAISPEGRAVAASPRLPVALAAVSAGAPGGCSSSTRRAGFDPPPTLADGQVSSGRLCLARWVTLLVPGKRPKKPGCDRPHHRSTDARCARRWNLGRDGPWPTAADGGGCFCRRYWVIRG
jgi:hypothetical protein